MDDSTPSIQDLASLAEVWRRADANLEHARQALADALPRAELAHIPQKDVVVATSINRETIRLMVRRATLRRTGQPDPADWWNSLAHAERAEFAAAARRSSDFNDVLAEKLKQADVIVFYGGSMTRRPRDSARRYRTRPSHLISYGLVALAAPADQTTQRRRSGHSLCHALGVAPTAMAAPADARSSNEGSIPSTYYDSPQAIDRRGAPMLMPELTAVAAEAADAVAPELLAASVDFDARAGALCRDVALRYRSGAAQATCFLSLVSRIVAEDRRLDTPPVRRDASPYRHDPLFRMLDRCAEALPAFIEGRRAGVDVIFPKGDRRLWAQMQGESLHMAGYGRLVAAAVRALMPRAGQMLEIGAGSGSATAALFARLDGPMPLRYVVSDISPTLLRDAHARFGSAGLEYAVHDFACPAELQALAAQQFDIVFGANALHCAADVKAALHHTLELVAPGGYLVLTEGTRPASGRVWRPELIFALLPGWWQVRTDPHVRPEVGFLSGPAWRALLCEAGLASVAVLPLGSPSSIVIGFLIVARKAGS